MTTKVNVQGTKENAKLVITGSVDILGISSYNSDDVFLTLKGLEEKFEAINPNTGETVLTSNARFNYFAFVHQIMELNNVPFELQMLERDARRRRKLPNPDAIDILLMNAKVTIIREFHAEGEERETADGVAKYTTDCWTTKIKGIEWNVTDQQMRMFNKKVAEAPFYVKEQVVDPFA